MKRKDELIEKHPQVTAIILKRVLYTESTNLELFVKVNDFCGRVWYNLSIDKFWLSISDGNWGGE